MILARLAADLRGACRPRVLIAFSVLSLSLGAFATHAQEPPAGDGPVVDLDPIVVRVPAASLRSAAAKAPGAAVTSIPAEQYAGEAKSAAELLATAPGVAIAEHGGPGQLSQISIRGSSAEQVRILMDGLPLSTAAGGGVDLSTIPRQWISRLEVVRGTEGVHHGSGALGGVVNVITTPAVAGQWGAGATAGSFGTVQGDAHLGLGGESWGLLGAVSGSTTRGDFPYRNPFLDRDETREHAAASQGGTLWKGFVLAGGGRLDALAQASGDRRQLPGPIGSPTPHDWEEQGRGLLSASFRRPLGDGPILASGAWLRLDRMVVSLDQLGGVPRYQRGLAGSGSLGLSWPGERGALSTSVEAGGERLEAGGIGQRSRPTIAAVLAGELVGWNGRARLGPGVRVERAGRFSGVSAKLGGTVELAGPLSARASLGRSYRVPSFAELYLQQGVVEPNPNLRPEVGLGGDAALVAAGRFGSASLGGFSVLYDDLVVYQAASFRRFSPMNDARTSARGLELEAALAPVRRLADLTGGLAYTYLRTETLRGTEEVVGKDVPQKPRHRLYARLGVGSDPAELHAECQWVSRRWVDLANQASVPASFTVGVGGSVRLLRNPDVHLDLEVRNLLDDRTVEDGFMNPLPGRAFLATLRAGNAERKP
jgi:iron complex outermembrane receptor protein